MNRQYTHWQELCRGCHRRSENSHGTTPRKLPFYFFQPTDMTPALRVHLTEIHHDCSGCFKEGLLARHCVTRFSPIPSPLKDNGENLIYRKAQKSRHQKDKLLVGLGPAFNGAKLLQTLSCHDSACPCPNCRCSNSLHPRLARQVSSACRLPSGLSRSNSGSRPLDHRE